MTVRNLGKTLIIANPAAHSGKGEQAIPRLERFFSLYQDVCESIDIQTTAAPLDAVHLAAGASEMDTVIVLGGDGVIHEAVNGLMSLDPECRPTLGIVAMGTGNDFARTLGLSFNDPDSSLAELVAGKTRKIDLGLVSSDLPSEGSPINPQETYFVETLSFGMDAAIALDTTERREADAHKEGSGLFVSSSVKMALTNSSGHPCDVVIDDERLWLNEVIFAIQNGPTYGGGFRICPDADPSDGLLDICYNTIRPPIPYLLNLLARARFGTHVSSPAVSLRKAKSIHLDFHGAQPPCQADGERVVGTRFEVSIIPQALDVIFA